MKPLLPSALRILLEDLEHLPGIGAKSAQRIAFYLLRATEERVEAFAEHLKALKSGTHRCTVCNMLSEDSLCPICADPQRDLQTLCIVEDTLDVLAIERTREFHGRYHVLGGVLSPLDHIGPEDLHIGKLIERIRSDRPSEVILALNPSTEGETTALYLKKLLASEGATLTRLAYGLPTGAAIEFADDLTITRALSGRQKVK